MIDRRGFLVGSLAAAATSAVPAAARPEEMRAMLFHLGFNFANSWYPPDLDMKAAAESIASERKRFCDTTLRCRDDYWKDLTSYAGAHGVNTVVIDISEGLVWPSHPELAVTGSWSPDRLRAELKRLRGLGLEPIPKLNFSATHAGWLKEYGRMLCTPAYYRVCEDLIRDAAEIFGTPRYLHIGYDEESADHQDKARNYLLVQARKGELWWHDFLFTVRTVEKHGMRAWAWSDRGWDDPTYFTRCPKSVLQSNWYYDESNGGFDPATNKTSDHKRLIEFWKLQEAGFDQVPCGTNWAGWGRRHQGVDAQDVIGNLVKLGRKVISPDRLKGFLMTVWKPLDTPENAALYRNAIDLLENAVA